MTWPTMLYFSSILLTCLLTGFLAIYAWRQLPLPGVRAYASLALSECLLALLEILSMVSGTQVQALFWFNLRFLFTGIIPVLFLIFTLEYTGRRDWISRPVLAAAFLIPALTQVVLWSNGLHGLWVKQESGFSQYGPFWIAETGQRVPGPWFMVHSFYSLSLLLVGIGLICLTAWRRRHGERSQALLLSAGALIALVTSLIPVFNLLPRAGFNPFIPGIGASALLYSLAIFRFQFLKKTPEGSGYATVGRMDALGNRSLASLLLVFIVAVTAIATAGYISYKNYEQKYRAQIEAQLTSIAALKVDGLVNWRAERLADAEALFHNTAFSALVQQFLENPDDLQAGAQLQTWLDTYRFDYHYEHVLLLDGRGVERFGSPAEIEPVSTYLAEKSAAALQAGQVTFLDIHRDAAGESIHLSLLVPIFAEQDPGRPLAVLALFIDPNRYLYPYLQNWPVPSQSAETLLIRREGNAALFLNELRFRSDAALSLSFPLTDTDIPSVKAVLEQTGIVEGTDYRGVPVIADLSAIPGSPWYLVSKIDTAEVYGPLRSRLWQTIIFIGVLIAASGTGLVMAWRQQRVRYYQAQYETAESLRKSQEQYRDLIEHASDGIFIADSSGKYVEVNPSGCAMLGFTRAEILSKRISDLVAPENLATAPLKLDELRQGKILLTERLLVCKDGSRLPVEISARMLPDGRFQSIQRDIRERKQAEEKLVASELRYRRLFEAARDGILILDADTGTVVDANPFLVEMLGFSKEEIQGKRIWDLGFFKDLLANQANFLELQQKEYIRYDDLPLETAGGRQIEVEFVSNMYTVDHQKVIQCNIRDITQRMRADEILKSYSEHLEAEVQQRTHELHEAQGKLLRQERLATLGQLAGSVGHELRNPLGVISNAIYFLKLSQPEADDQVRDYLGIIENETRAADKIINDLLDFSRVRNTDREPVSVPELVQRVLNRYPVPGSVTVSLLLPASLPFIYVDPRQMEQVLGNLVVNACQAMSSAGPVGTPGGGKLTLSGKKKAGMVAISVRDTGVGIPPENMGKLFEPLFTTKTKGTGLGLAVSQLLTEANGGRIEVASKPGKGSTFTVFLPASQ